MASVGDSRSPDAEEAVVVVPPQPAANSLTQASKRRSKISERIEQTHPWREDWAEREQPRDSRIRRSEVEFSSNADVIRLEHQARSAPLLLAARVTDAILNEWDSNFDETTRAQGALARDIGYCCTPIRHGRMDGTIGSYVRVETGSPAIVASLLRRVPHDWLAIETMIVHRPRLREFDSRGQIGGYIETRTMQRNAPYSADHVGLTCHHVAPTYEHYLDAFVDFYRRCDLDAVATDTACPDAKLVQVDALPEDAGRLAIANPDDVSRSLLNSLLVRRTPGSGSEGLIADEIESFSHLGVINRFPTLRVLPRRRRLFGMLNWPPRASVARAGDSGSWLINAESHLWHGMVVAGRPELGEVYAHRAFPLAAMIAKYFDCWSEPWFETLSRLGRRT